MRIRLTSLPKQTSYEADIERYNTCDCDIDRFLRAKTRNNIRELVKARIDVSRHAPTGVYFRGDDSKRDLYAVLGVLRRRDCLEHKGVFFVRYARIHAFGVIDNAWSDMPLTSIDEESFLAPLPRTHRYQPRFVWAGELVHAS